MIYYVTCATRSVKCYYFKNEEKLRCSASSIPRVNKANSTTSKMSYYQKGTKNMCMYRCKCICICVCI